jgi:predicted transcriptional regulator
VADPQPLHSQRRAIALALLANGPMDRVALRAVTGLSVRRWHHHSRIMRNAKLIKASGGIISLTPIGEARILEEPPLD